ncbi:MAG TPA: hypothetical protein VF085_09925 [Solirubrobacterales bacterium]
MLYLHCGWGRTSTSSLQAALYANRDRLAAAGVVYPDKWRAATVPAHHRLNDLVNDSPGSVSALDDFRRFLVSNADRNVLFSAERITGWLLSSERQEAFLRLLVAAQGVTPTRCIWTLRRFDQLLESLYLLMLWHGNDLPPPAAYLRRRMEGPVFEGMRRVEDLAGIQVAYVKYCPDGAHNGELLHTFGISDSIGAIIREELERGPRLNISPSHKEAVALASAEELSERARVTLDVDRLRAAFKNKSFRFDRDRRCELVSEAAKRNVHKRALAAARRYGIESYCEFFEGASIIASESYGLDAAIIDNEELKRLVAHLGLSKPP